MNSLARKILFALIGLVLMPAETSAELPIRPTLHSEIIAEYDTLRLNDFFEPAGEHGETVVAYAPKPGRHAIFDANWLARLAQRYGLDWRPSSRSDQSVVERLSTVITASDIVAALENELTALGFGEDYELSINNPQLQIHIPADQPATISVIDISADATGDRVMAVIAAPAGDPTAKRFKVQGRLHAVVEIPVPAYPLRPGRVINADDITWVKFRRAQLRNNMLSDPGDLIGKTARIPLRAGHPVRTTEVHAPALIRKGDNVNMIFRTETMFLTANGIALEAGLRDDIISVRNNQSGTVIEAAIVGPDRVEARVTNLQVRSER